MACHERVVGAAVHRREPRRDLKQVQSQLPELLLVAVDVVAGPGARGAVRGPVWAGGPAYVALLLWVDAPDSKAFGWNGCAQLEDEDVWNIQVTVFLGCLFAGLKAEPNDGRFSNFFLFFLAVSKCPQLHWAIAAVCRRQCQE